MAKEKAQYEPSSAQRDLEARREANNENPATVLSTYKDADESVEDDGARSFEVEDNDTSDALATSPEYAGYGIEQNKPLRAEEGPEAEVEAEVYGDDDSGSKTKNDPSLADKAQAESDKK